MGGIENKPDVYASSGKAWVGMYVQHGQCSWNRDEKSRKKKGGRAASLEIDKNKRIEDYVA